ncbi:MAG: hypothetical protein JWO06_2247 [Bacteroidota bacterium]|nr:hypothetical protein [Bacteroidota bacterium]
MEQSDAKIYFLLALGAFAFASVYFIKYYFAITYWISVKGFIVSRNRSYPAPGNLFIPAIRYTTLEGEDLTIHPDFLLSGFAYEEGQELDILYNPDKPTKFIIKGKASLGLPVIFLLVGLGLLFYIYLCGPRPERYL